MLKFALFAILKIFSRITKIMSVQIAVIRFVGKTIRNQIPICARKRICERMYTEEEAIQAFQGATSRISGQHHELSDTAYYKLLLKAKLSKRCPMNQ